MLSNRLAFAALAIACIGAAAGGGYFATRQNTVPTPASAQSQQAQPAPVAEPATAPAATAAPALAPSDTAAAPKTIRDAESVGRETPPKPASAAKPSAARPREMSARVNAERESRPATAAMARREPAAFPVASNNSATQPPAPVPPVIESAPVAPRPEERPAPEPVRPVEPQHTFTELTVSADSVIGLQTENRVSTETARVEDRVEARVTRDVKVGDHVAIPAGSRAIGSVILVDRGGKVKDRAHLGIRFHTLVLADGTRMPISTDPIYRDGEAPSNSSSSKIGGAAVGGAILGAILGGGKGAAIGAGVGAGAGGAAVAAGDRNAATLPAGTVMTVKILQPLTVTTDSK
jgi:hypothetical protein